MSDLLNNVFESDAFGFTSLVQSINKLPFVPGRVTQLGLFKEQAVATTSVSFEEQYGLLQLVDPSARGGAGEARAKNPRKARLIKIPHYQLDDNILAEEIQNVREFGQNMGMRSIQSLLASRMEMFTSQLDVTLEFQRLNALKGIVVDKSGATIYNLFSEFNVPQPTAIAFQLSSATADIRKVAATVKRTILRNLGGASVGGVYALCGDTFWDTLITHPLVKETFLYQEGRALRDGIAYESFTYGGITWENYRGYIAPIDGGADDGSNATPFISASTCQFFPVGVPNLFWTYFAPADYQETVNTLGLPRYAKSVPSDNGKSTRLEMQTNPLSVCTRPRALIQGTMS
jgi:hypothetical protein